LHASDLPHGRGWSPHVWEIIRGATEITLSLIEADDKVDSGKIWKKSTFSVPKHALWNEINHALFQAEIELIDHAIRNFKNICPVEQVQDIEATYNRRRVPEDSRINPSESIVSQFDLIRVCDPGRFPAFFELYGQRYKILLEKSE
jgi:methionyl-tRNA formyltransferase